MNATITKKPKAMALVEVELPWEEVMRHIKRAAKEYSENRTISGFRKGQAPYEVVEKKLGVPALLELATESLVAQTYFKVLKEHKMETIGAPKVTVLPRGPEQEFRFHAETAVMPEVTLPDFKEVRVVRTPVEVKEEDINKLMDELRWMGAKDHEIQDPAAMGHKVTVIYRLSQGNVPLEGGTDIDTSVILGKTQVLPEFAEHIQGMKAGESKQFKVKFPASWSRKDLAGRNVDVDLNVKTVARIDLPAADDEFAKSMGDFSGIDQLKEKMKENLQREKEQEEDQRIATAALAAVTEKSNFGEIPDIMINAECDRILEDIAARLEGSGITMAQWLERTKKTDAALREEMKPQAFERVKSLLVMRNVAQEQDIKAEDQEVLQEVEEMVKQAQGDLSIQDRVRTHEFHEYLQNKIVTRKTVEWIKERVAKGGKKEEAVK